MSNQPSFRPVSPPRFQTQIAQSWRHRSQVFRLRYDVFHREARGAPLPWGIDHDRYDLQACHLVVVDSTTDRVVGTYRMLSGLRVRRFYSESEFDLGELAQRRSETLELGRACIAKEARNGVTLAMLWRGVLAHAYTIGVRYLLGCSSVFTDDRATMAALFGELERKGKVDLSAGARPLAGEWDCEPRPWDEEPLPHLLRAYLSAGAKVVSRPAWDPFFRCFDVLTLLDLKALPQRYLR